MREHKNNQRPRNIHFGKKHISVPNYVNYPNSPFPKAQKSKLNQPTKTKSKPSTIIIKQDQDNNSNPVPKPE